MLFNLRAERIEPRAIIESEARGGAGAEPTAQILRLRVDGGETPSETALPIRGAALFLDIEHRLADGREVAGERFPGRH